MLARAQASRSCASRACLLKVDARGLLRTAGHAWDLQRAACKLDSHTAAGAASQKLGRPVTVPAICRAPIDAQHLSHGPALVSNDLTHAAAHAVLHLCMPYRP